MGCLPPPCQRAWGAHLKLGTSPGACASWDAPPSTTPRSARSAMDPARLPLQPAPVNRGACDHAATPEASHRAPDAGRHPWASRPAAGPGGPDGHRRAFSRGRRLWPSAACGAAPLSPPAGHCTARHASRRDALAAAPRAVPGMRQALPSDPPCRPGAWLRPAADRLRGGEGGHRGREPQCRASPVGLRGRETAAPGGDPAARRARRRSARAPRHGPGRGGSRLPRQ
jgi:hypothetical protein